MKGYAFAAMPLVIGVALALLWQSGVWTNPVIYFRGDGGTILLLIGFALTLAAAAGVFIRQKVDRRYQQASAAANVAQADAHRRFVQRLDHELKNPLTAIRAGLANLTETGDVLTLSSVRAQVNRLARLTADLRKLADLETLPIEQDAVDLGQLLDELYALAQERPEIAHCQLNLALPQAPWPLPPVAGDRDLLFLALHNLIDNAIKFSQTGDTIEIRGYEDGPSVTVQIADTGPGVSEEDLPHLGEELFRGSTARGVEGSGLGLAMVNAIVTRHKGTLAIRSRLGQGTVVALRFPAVR